MPSLPSVEFNGNCMPQPGAKQAAKPHIGHSQDEPFVWLQRKSSTALWNSCATAFGGLLNTLAKALMC